MIVPSSIASDVDTALEVITRDTSATWLNAAADMLEDCAKRVRASVAEEKAKAEKTEVKP